MGTRPPLTASMSPISSHATHGGGRTHLARRSFMNLAAAAKTSGAAFPCPAIMALTSVRPTMLRVTYSSAGSSSTSTQCMQFTGHESIEPCRPAPHLNHQLHCYLPLSHALRITRQGKLSLPGWNGPAVHSKKAARCSLPAHTT